jgi:8-oxo-dGTP diphosphatase
VAAEATNIAIVTVVAAALVDPEGRVLLQRRPSGGAMPGLWEFPGGKIEAGEVPEAALVRELREELSIEADPASLVPSAFASAPLGGAPPQQLLLLLYLCGSWEGTARALHADSIRWLHPSDMRSLPMPPADEPLVAALERLL